VFCLRYARRWETLTANNLNAALAARALKEAALLTEESSPAEAPAKRIDIDQAVSVYLSNTAATKKHRTLLAYTLASGEFRKSCTKQFLDELTKQDLTVSFAKIPSVSRINSLRNFLRPHSAMNSIHVRPLVALVRRPPSPVSISPDCDD